MKAHCFAAAVFAACSIGACTRSEPPLARGMAGGSGTPAETIGAGGVGTAGGRNDGPVSTTPEACRWDGWYRAPRMPLGCTGLCIPDDVKVRVPTLTWTQRPDWCEGCLHLETPWATTDAQKQDAVGMAVQGHGMDAVTLALGLNVSDAETAVFDGATTPVAAWRIDFDQPRPCGRLWGLPFSGGSIGAWFVERVSDPYKFFHVPVTRASDLMNSTESTFIWPAAFTRGRGINDLWFSDAMIAADFSGSIGLGDFSTGEAIEINEAATGLPGFYNEAQLVGRTAFVSRYTGSRSEWFVAENGRPRLFLGDEQNDIYFLVTDGETIIYKRGVEPYPNPDGSVPPVLYRRYDLYRAPYTTEPAELQPRLLLANVSAGLSHARIQNGYLVASYLTQYEPQPRQGSIIVVRLSDGRAWEPKLPSGWSWGWVVFPSATELWGAVTRYYAASKFETVARVPYGAMQVLQEAAAE